jgi:hypothetical protein
MSSNRWWPNHPVEIASTGNEDGCHYGSQMLNTPLIISIASLLAAAIGVYYQRRQTLVAEAEILKGRQLGKSWITSPAVITMVALAVLAWIPSIKWLLEAPHPEILGWGGVLGMQPLTLEITVNGSSLDWYSNSHRLIAVAMHYYGDKDISDVDAIQKSPPFEIRKGAVVIMIRPKETYVNEFVHGAINTNYHLLLVPRGVNDKAFSTLRQAKELGAFDIWSGSGPP